MEQLERKVQRGLLVRRELLVILVYLDQEEPLGLLVLLDNLELQASWNHCMFR
jgi:hypothetical protein